MEWGTSGKVRGRKWEECEMKRKENQMRWRDGSAKEKRVRYYEIVWWGIVGIGGGHTGQINLTTFFYFLFFIFLTGLGSYILPFL